MRRAAGCELARLHGKVTRHHAPADKRIRKLDVQLGRRHWGPGSHFAISPDSVLVHSPKREEGECDTDVQTLGDEKKRAHSSMNKGMLLL